MRQKYALRRALPIFVAAVLLTAIFVDVVAAGVKAVSSRSRVSYPAPGGTVTISVPNAMKGFPAELLPQ